MDWVPETAVVGEEPATEFSLCHIGRHLWVTLDPDGSVDFRSATPTSLRSFFPTDTDAGTETFARGFLGWLRVEAYQPTGQLLIRPSCTATEAREAQVFSFQGARPLVRRTGLEFNRDFRPGSGTIFELRGQPHMVDEWVARYLREFPPVDYNTRIIPQLDHSTPDTKTVRVLREFTFD